MAPMPPPKKLILEAMERKSERGEREKGANNCFKFKPLNTKSLKWEII